jgi:hypothetical protein
MVWVEEVASLAGSLGTAAGLARVNAAMGLLNQRLLERKEVFSRAELAQMAGALDFLSAAIFSMDRVTRELLAERVGAVDCVG